MIVMHLVPPARLLPENGLQLDSGAGKAFIGKS